MNTNEISNPGISQTLLQALNLVAASLQLSIQSEEDVFRVFGDSLSDLGLRGSIGLLDRNGKELSFPALGYSGNTTRALSRLEKLTGIKIFGFKISINRVDVYRQAMETQKAIFAPDSTEVVLQILPNVAKRFSEQIIKVFNNVPVICAPLIVRGKVLGILNIGGEKLTNDDVNILDAFANQVSIALDNARLFTELRNSKETYRRLVDTSPVAVTLTDMNGTITYASQQTLDLHGFNQTEEILGINSMELIAPEDQESALKNIRKTLEEGVVRDVEYTLLKADGTRFEGELNASLIRSLDGKPQAFIATTKDISERKRREENYRSLVEKSFQGFIVLQGLHFVFVNGAFCEISGYSKEELLDLSPENVRAMVHPDDQERVWNNFERRIKGEDAPLRYSYRGIHKDKSVRWLEMIANRIEYNGKPAIQAAILDITEQIRMETAFKESEDKLRDIFANVSEFLYSHDLEGNFLETNLVYKQVYGYTDDEIRVMNIRDLLPKRYKRDFQNYINAVLENGKAEGIMTIKTKDGRRRYLEYNNSLIQNETGISGVRGSARDITDRLRAEQKLRESEERYRLFLQNFQGIAFRGKIGFKPIFFHGKIEEITGYTETDFVASDLTWDQIIFPEDFKAIKESIEDIHNTPGFSTAREYRIIRKDGQTRWVYELLQNICDDSGKPIEVQGSIYDITDRKETEDRLKKSEARFRTLVENIKIGVYRNTGGTSGRFYHANPAMLEMFGYDSFDEFMKVSVADLYQEPSERARFVEEVLSRGYIRDQELQLIKKDGTPFWASCSATAKFNQRGELEWLDGVIEDITERKRAEEQLLHNAFYDTLTDLPNRALFTDRLDRAIERSKRRDENLCTVLFLDLDRFKVVNDSMGHAYGDKLLISVARRLSKCMRSADTLARLGGDEFGVLLEEIGNLGNATMIADRILNETKMPFSINGKDVYITASIGIVVNVQGYKRPEDVIRDADIAMYRAKNAGKDRYEIYNPKMHENALKRMSLELELRQAIEKSEFLVYYQPIVSLKPDTLHGFEALLRWKHPERGVISPSEFLPIMEETGIIIPVGQWLIDESCKQIKQWNDEYSHQRPLSISVNISGKEFAHYDLAVYIQKALEESGLEPRHFILEITEGVIMSDPEYAMQLLKKLGELGIQIHLDDFGTGYSSFSKLIEFPIDALKIDKSFINTIEEVGEQGESAIVGIILALAKNLRMDAVAEGVETEQQLRYLNDLNCNYCQGYFFSKPLDKTKAMEFITKKLGSR